MTIPQLRVRTEFTFRQTFAPMARVGAALEALGAPAAGIVDGGTWGHVRFAKEAEKRGFRPLFGTELTVPTQDGRKPSAWALAIDTKAFYRFSSAARQKGADITGLFAGAAGSVLRFAGAALEDPETFDYIDLNPASRLLNRRALKLAERTGKPLVLTSDNWYPAPEDRDAFMAICAQERITPQHLLNLAEMREQFSFLDDATFERAVRNTHEAAEIAASQLPKAPIIRVEGDLRAMAEAGRDRRLALGHLKSWPQEYADRFEHELQAIQAKEFDSYFIVVADLISWAKERMLVGPGRGSSAGSLVCYCLGITEVDPIPHHLLFERFIDVTRADLPDIDIDFNDTKRDMVFDYLAEKYGVANVARIGNVNTLKPRSALAEVCKRLGVPDHARYDVLNVLVEYSSGDARFGNSLIDTFTTTLAGKQFTEQYPEAMVVQAVENHAWHTGVHAAGVIVCNVPVTDYCTVTAEGVAQIDKPDSEYLNLLKIDALGLTTLGIIEDSGVVTSEELYALTMDDPEVLRIFDEKKFCGIFQFEGNAQRNVSAQIKADSFRTLDHVTALARPGPLGGGAAGKYIDRKAGREEVSYTHPALAEMLADTYGVVLYQEQVMRIVREIGKFSWADTTVIRKAMSGRKGKEFFDRQGEKFIKGAAEDGIDAATAAQIWEEICSFGAWGMNRSHTCAYAVISYWCAWMKRYHPLEYAAACLRSAKDDDQAMAILREMKSEGVDYVPFDFEHSQQHWSVQNGRLVGGFRNLVGFGPAKSAAAIEARDNGLLPKTLKERTENESAYSKPMLKLFDRIAAAEVKFKELYPLHVAYADLYNDPYSHGIRPGSRIVDLMDMPVQGDVLILGKLTKKELRDENEVVRAKRRGGKLIEGPNLFADLFIHDDSGGPVTVRVDRFNFDPLGRAALENLVVGEDVILVRGRRIPNFNMVKAERIRCLTNPGAVPNVVANKRGRRWS